MKPLNFTQVTIVDFTLTEASALRNKARVIGHEVDKLRRDEQGILATIGGVLEIVFDSTEDYYEFPPPGHFYIERGH